MAVRRYSPRTINSYLHWIRYFILYHGKGGKHRLTTLAPELVPLLATQMKRVEVLLEQDSRVESYGGVWMPDALARKYQNASKSLGWQYLFPASCGWRQELPESGRM